MTGQGETKPAQSANTAAKEVASYLKILGNQDLKEEQVVVVEMLKEILVDPVIGKTIFRKLTNQNKFIRRSI